MAVCVLLLLSLLVPVSLLAAAPAPPTTTVPLSTPPLTVLDDSPLRGIFDPCLLATGNATVPYVMSYSAVTATDDISTHAAVYVASASVWAPLAAINAAAVNVTLPCGGGGEPCVGSLIHEVSTLIADPGDAPARVLKAFTHSYAVTGGSALHYQWGHISLWTAPGVGGPWTGGPLLGWASDSPLSTDAPVSLSAIPALSDCLCFTEPSALRAANGTLLLALGCVSLTHTPVDVGAGASASAGVGAAAAAADTTSVTAAAAGAAATAASAAASTNGVAASTTGVAASITGVARAATIAAAVAPGTSATASIRIVLLASDDHARSWRYTGCLVDGVTDAARLGYGTVPQLDAAQLFAFGGALFVSVTPSAPIEALGGGVGYVGCLVLRLTPDANAVERGADGAPLLQRAVLPGGSAFAGACTVAAAQTEHDVGGYMLPVLDALTGRFTILPSGVAPL